MPIFLDPNEIFPLVLDCSKGKTNPPTFMVKAQTIRKQRELKKWEDEVREWSKPEEITVDDIHDKQIDKLIELIVDWKNVNKPLNRESLLDSLDKAAVRELLDKIHNNQHLSVDEKKS